MTSHDVVQLARRALRTRRVGHAGTLDPFATGLLTLLVGSATRLSRYLTGLSKDYHGVLRLGVDTDTDDLTGTVTRQASVRVDDARLRAAMTRLTGTLEQLPPTYSAKKIGGVAAHRRVRRGESVDVPRTTVVVHRFTLRDRRGDDVTFEASVGSGTYIRSLARDLGADLGCGAHLRSLRRVRVGPYEIQDARPVEGMTPEDVLPVERAVAHLPRIEIGLDALDAVSHGRAIDRPEAVPATGPVAIFHERHLAAVGEAAAAVIQPRVVLSQ